MKFIAVILSIYVMGLTFVPCADDHTGTLDSDCTSFVQEQKDHSHSSTEADFCSPFCYCICCQTVFHPEYTDIQKVAPDTHSIKIALTTRSFISPVITFWRPPKIGYAS